ncbi:MAG: helix-turn-helix domain-containing protein [Chloroflexota bacterium]|nr:helix-turn-helix domain-containing protein [Chloroflexota bacterium]GIK29627.1 MAG: CdaR family transcriptional regulator [Chloroflexota bacterium]
MTDSNTVSLQYLLRTALPPETQLIAGPPDAQISWAVALRAQPPADNELYGGELALVQMDLLRSFESRIGVTEVVQRLADANAAAVALRLREDVPPQALSIANQHNVALIVLPPDANMARVEREINRLIVSGAAQVTQRAIEVQRELVRAAAENRELGTLLQIIARATGKTVVVHDDAGVQTDIAQVSGQRRPAIGARGAVDSAAIESFQRWLQRESSKALHNVVSSPLGFTTTLQVEKRVAGFLSLITGVSTLDEFDRLVLTYGAEVCAVQLAKTRAIATAVEQTRGDWVQMWLSGTSADDDMLMARADQSGFDPDSLYVTTAFRAVSASGVPLPLDSLIGFVRDDLTRRQIEFAIGQYVDLIVLLYPLDSHQALTRARQQIEYLREQLHVRAPGGVVAAGISRPVQGLRDLRAAYREAKDSLTIAQQLGDIDKSTYYGDLKLYQLLLGVKDRSLQHLRRFYEEALAPLVEHNDRKQGDLIRTLNGFFDANGNLAKAASDLAVHRNTLVYRLDRISELTGLDLNDPDNRLILHLALKVQRVLATLPSS